MTDDAMVKALEVLANRPQLESDADMVRATWILVKALIRLLIVYFGERQGV